MNKKKILIVAIALTCITSMFAARYRTKWGGWIIAPSHVYFESIDEWDDWMEEMGLVEEFD